MNVHSHISISVSQNSYLVVFSIFVGGERF